MLPTTSPTSKTHRTELNNITSIMGYLRRGSKYSIKTLQHGWDQDDYQDTELNEGGKQNGKD